MSTTIAVYAGTFDPLTRGHEDIARRAARIFDKVIIAIAVSEKKKPIFSLEERIEIAREVMGGLPNVEVKGFSSLLMQFARQEEAQVVIRGVRAVSDFDYEFQLAGMNRDLYPEIETVFMTPGEQYMFISATLVREIAAFGGDVTKFVPPPVVARLKAKYHN
ncbi:pantetheine-phosphate adenylyltransferase [Denitratisoma sp. DHT3]|uniref:pantetheine-phosphate adenylyltransferase n=1 Tax=Denitratisoma sp. DHT3 TaxID=1981880 RepID=UPI00119833C0|nr:pantetheine-phosphate adenylyltransferase [Denitratisoma sp. DHT3]QDX82028.1 pantetheine-phosphate adenylyltransferase [Denitratisoma sp. DHT3]